METIEKNGTVFVLVPQDAWNKLSQGEVPMPEFPPADADGNMEAIAFARVSIARNIIKARVAAGLSQAQLADRAGISRQVLNRIERAKVTADEATVRKLVNAMKPTKTAKRLIRPPKSPIAGRSGRGRRD